MQHIRCSLVHIVIAIVFITAGCGDEMVVPTSGAAGKVVSIEGLVTATRAGETRTLKDDDVVYVEDTVKTAKGASVIIVLTHNNVEWSLEGDIEVSVKGSAAFRASKQKESTFAKRAELGTSAAAANTSKMGADTADTVVRSSAVQEASPVRKPIKKVAPEEEVPADTELDRTLSPGGSNKGGLMDLATDEENPRKNRERLKVEKRKVKKSTGEIGGPPPDPTVSVEQETQRVPRRPSPGTSTGNSGISVENKTKSWIAKAAKRCRASNRGGKGTLKYELVIKDGKVVSFKVETSSSPGLAALAACLKKKLQASSAKDMASAKSTLRFP